MIRGFVLASSLLAFILAAASAQAPTAKATIIIHLPPDAELVIGTQKMTQTGGERRFETPELETGSTYSYEVTVHSKHDLAEITQTKTVKFEPGKTVTVKFHHPKVAVAPPQRIEPVPAKTTETKSPPKSQPKSEPKSEPKKTETKKEAPKNSEAKSRSFVFTYAGKITDLKPGQSANVWLPLPPNNAEQSAVIQQIKIPGVFLVNKDKLYNNTILHFTAQANDKGEVPFEVVIKASRKEVKTDAQANITVKAAEDSSLIDRFLKPDAMVPIAGKPLDLLKDQKLPGDQFAAAKVLYDVVNGHMKYSKEGKGWGRGDSEWACDSKFGNCTDFHSLFISMARGNKIPSKFEMGFPIPDKHGEGEIKGYHCWAWFMPAKKGWVPVDISEANRNPDLKEYYFGNLTENRLQYTTGRDIELVPKQSGPPLNFFIYPYAEVDGQPYPAEKIVRSFSFKDL
jgi:uncharacterized protein (TIGR03000 family)